MKIFLLFFILDTPDPQKPKNKVKNTCWLCGQNVQLLKSIFSIKSMWTFKYLQPWTSRLWQIQHPFSEALTVCIICHCTFVIALSLPIIFCKDLDSMTKLRQDSTSSNTEVWGLVRMTRFVLYISPCQYVCSEACGSTGIRDFVTSPKEQSITWEMCD